MDALQADCATLKQIHEICFSFFYNRSGHSYIKRMNTQRRQFVPVSNDWERGLSEEWSLQIDCF